MAIFTESYALLSDDSYDEGKRLDGTPFRIERTVDDPSGYHGVIYRNENTDELVVAHRGDRIPGG